MAACGQQPRTSETPDLMKTDHAGPFDALRLQSCVFASLGFQTGEKTLDLDMNVLIPILKLCGPD